MESPCREHVGAIIRMGINSQQIFTGYKIPIEPTPER